MIAEVLTFQERGERKGSVERQDQAHALQLIVADDLVHPLLQLAVGEGVGINPHGKRDERRGNAD